MHRKILNLSLLALTAFQGQKATAFDMETMAVNQLDLEHDYNGKVVFEAEAWPNETLIEGEFKSSDEESHRLL